MNSTEKYLAKYAEPEAALLAGLPARFTHCVCIPAYDESLVFIQRTLEFLANQPATLAVIVLNRPDANDALSAHNADARSFLQQRTQCNWRNRNLSLHTLASDSINNHSAVLLVDRFDLGDPIPHQQGVGLARKISADIALQLIYRQLIRSHWIYSTDADTVLPNNYFQLPMPDAKQDVAAFVLGYRHITGGDSAIDRATQIYETRLRAYVSGLAYAGSPYAFNTVGSTLCIDAHHYAMVRGFPKRAAGEDFYLLNKLRKTGRIIELAQPIVDIKSRISNRTPFGTGTAVADILNYDNVEDAAIFYHPQLFELLKTLLQGFDEIAAGFDASTKITIQWRLVYDMQASIILALQAMDFDNAIAHCVANSRDQQQFSRHLQHWFDGFRTLKWLHHIRGESGLHNISLLEYQALHAAQLAY